MSDRMTPIPFGALMQWILAEKKQEGSVFGVRRAFTAAPNKRLPFFAEALETPIGPAAGPHTQLAQNIIAAYYAGARFFELKTIQTLDGEDLPVSKPCILAEDECYNVEWSTELRAQEAVNEYVKAWFALKLLSRAFGLGRENGFAFNMSVGYDFAGITSEKIDACIETLKDASRSAQWAACREWAYANMDALPGVDAAYIEGVCPQVCRSITLSTLHGCPPQEIERIAGYLMEKKKLVTFVKCNPTLLGYAFARRTLDEMGYGYIQFNDFHFRDDLQYGDAIPMFKRLTAKAAENGVSFGLKLTNTFPVDIARGELPGSEMYMSGRSLYPLTIELARRLTEEFDGGMRISFSGGIDAFNAAPLFEAGVWPITLATTLLKPGGYQRLTQLAQSIEKLPYKAFDGVSVGKLEHLALSARRDARHIKPVKPLPKRKLSKKLPLTSCFTAPCAHGCPIGQDIPEYVSLVGRGAYEEALSLVLERNPLPFMTGTICTHRCMEKCTRNFYEEAVRIRAAKLCAAKNGFDGVIDALAPRKEKNGARVAVVGGGPAGMACAFFLARQGASVTLIEKREKLGGVVRYVIPGFRIGDDAVDSDARLLAKMGADVRTGSEAPSADALFKQGYTHVVYAVGAQKEGQLRLEKGEVLNAIRFLEAFRAGGALDLGADVVIAGGGNTAMDAARAAKRVPGVERVRLVYRRTKRYMPADEEELKLALDDGVEFLELLSPVSLENGMLLCHEMALGAPDASGRRAPEATDKTRLVPCTALVAAVGEKADGAFLAANGLALNEKGGALVNADTLEASRKHVFVIGDANRGPATVVEAIADARRAADAIVGPYAYALPPRAAGAEEVCLKKQGVLRVYDHAEKEAERCLSCSTVCECCVQVCPNRANVAVRVPGMAMPQIIHVDRLCNECGNCLVFCPYDGAPYKEKLTLFSTEKEFDESENLGFLPLQDGRVKLRLDGGVRIVAPNDDSVPAEVSAVMEAVLNTYRYLL